MSELREECGVVGVFLSKGTYEWAELSIMAFTRCSTARTGELRNRG